MTSCITSDLVEAYIECPRKALLMTRGHPPDTPHEYYEIVAARAISTRKIYLQSITEKGRVPDSRQERPQPCECGVVQSEDLLARCDAVSTEHRNARKGEVLYAPHIVVGTHSITKQQRIRLAFAGYVLGRIGKLQPKAGTIVSVAGRPQRTQIESLYSRIRSTVASVKEFRDGDHVESPPLVLNNSCPTCQFRQHCMPEAEEADNLSLLARITPKQLTKYHAKGIFTVTQLSYLFRPRRHRKRQKVHEVTFSFELQALALRTGKIYLKDIAPIPDNEVEIFLDIEGIPDENFYYLIGLIVNDKSTVSNFSLWAKSEDDERSILEEFIRIVSRYPKAPIYHYGGYDSRALLDLQTKYGIDCACVRERLVNVNALIFGKIYFPSRSNRLKDLGVLVGATWDHPEESGIDSIAWRMKWEETNNQQLQDRLISYNRNDCHALYLLLSKLRQLGRAADAEEDVDFADDPKQYATDEGATIHRAFEHIIRSAHAEYGGHRVHIATADNDVKQGPRGGQKGHAGYTRIVPGKVNKVVRVEPRHQCQSARHPGEPLEPTGVDKEHTVIDIKFTRHGCKKVITKFVGEKAHCLYCGYDFVPPKIEALNGRLFGDALQAWAVYQRVALRLPYNAIKAQVSDLFSEEISTASVVHFVHHLAELYEESEDLSLRRILSSPFVHVDETKINIQGVDNFVWVFTDGPHVVFRLTETRETSVVREILADYQGVLVSDFYGGYDSVTPRQQKCLVHLIRDLNDDLWKNPFNEELERFVAEIQNLFVRIFTDVERYGLKTRHLRKHMRSVDDFFRRKIDVPASSCELVAKYQKRFQRYRDSMFLFLQVDGIPWNNNTAERAIRHLAIQRKISGSFYRPTAVRYLRLLGISQTCRFQGKSFLRFLLSEERDVDRYREARRSKSTLANER